MLPRRFQFQPPSELCRGWLWARVSDSLEHLCRSCGGGDEGGLLTPTASVDSLRMIHSHLPEGARNGCDVNLSACLHRFVDVIYCAAVS